MAESNSSTVYDPYTTIPLHDEQGYGNPSNDKQAFTPVEGAVSGGGGSTKDSKQFYDMETLRPQAPMPVKNGQSRWRHVVWSIRYFLTVVLVGFALAIPVIVFREDRDLNNVTSETADQRQYRNLIYYIFLWLVISWLGACVSDMFILAFPFVFRLVAGYVNPAYQRYWRIFRPLRKPIVLLGFIIACYGSFQSLINFNDMLVVNSKKDPTQLYWDDILYDVLQQSVFWIIGYLLVKILVLYISIHYHSRSDQVKLSHSKEMHDALNILYEASVYLQPLNSRHFTMEDSIIRSASGSGHDSSMRQGASNLLRKVGIDGHNIIQFFGKYNTDKGSHWFHPAAPYATVERALSHPKSAAALAKRIWMSLVVQGREAFTAEDIAEVLGPYRRDEAKEIFKVIDENESGDIRLEEMVWTVVEAGRIRHAIYQHMADIDHCINNFDWIALLILAVVMIFFILVEYVQTIKTIRDTLAYLAIGAAFAVGRTMNKYLVGCIFVFFEHPFDVGDRVNIYNMAATSSVSAIVVRQSLLYTLFRRVDNGTDLQVTNERLAQKRIENISRSGVNKQKVSISVDFKTSFKDLMDLRAELEAFLNENPRDFQPALGLSIVDVHELSKLELSVSFTHKSNWSDEKLRATRSAKFMCALVAVARKVPLYKPNGALAVLGDEGRPVFTASITDAEALAKVAAEKKKRADARMDALKEEARAAEGEAAGKKADKERADREAEDAAMAGLAKLPANPVLLSRLSSEEAVSMGVDALIKYVSTGLRAKSVSGPAGMMYQP